MGGFFSTPTPPAPPAPDPEIARLRAENEARAAEEKQSLLDKEANEKDARNRRLRGRASLLTQGPKGFADNTEDKETLGE